MKKVHVFAALGLLLSSFILSSYSPVRGGEGFEILLDGKPVVQRFGNEMNTVQRLQIDPRSAPGKLTIKYHHCGKTGRNRYIAIKDEKQQVLKEWRYADKEGFSSMSCPVNEILGIQKGNRAAIVYLYYSSSELPEGRTLASFVLPAKNLTTP